MIVTNNTDIEGTYKRIYANCLDHPVYRKTTFDAFMYFEVTGNIGEWVIGSSFCSGSHLAASEGGFTESPEQAGVWGLSSPSWSPDESIGVFCQGRFML